VARADEGTIVVTINYRLSVFGFLGSNALRGTDQSTGNWGLQDQRAAMKWVGAVVWRQFVWE
jgi:carboxylesterase type B